MNEGWYMEYAAHQDKWPSDSLPVCKDLSSVREPVEKESNLLFFFFFFFSVCDPCTGLDTLSSHSVSRDSLSQ